MTSSTGRAAGGSCSCATVRAKQAANSACSADWRKSLAKSIEIGDISLEAFPVEHSLIAPAAGYRITCAGNSIFYVPDVVSVCDQARALSGASVYIGDGASISRPLVRKRDGALIGHAPIKV